MENKLNISAIELYARKALKPFLDAYFENEHITGHEILRFSDIEQVNFFVIYQLFDKWKAETDNLKSPYFDFSHPEVKEALTVFMGRLSQHMLVKKEHFSPLLLQSIIDTLHYTLSPLRFLESKHISIEKVYTTDELKHSFKYLKAHPVLSAFYTGKIVNWEGKTGGEIMAQIGKEFGETYANKELSAQTVSLFNELLPVKEADFYYTEPSSASATTATPKKEQETKTAEVKHVTLNDLLGKEQKPSVLNLHTKNKIVDIRSAMSINQKFMFIKELFKNDTTAFEGAMSLADKCETYEKAVNTLIDTYSHRYSWEIDSAPVNELFDLVGRKFYPEAFNSDSEVK